jgi:hypothetical protein
LGDFEFRNLPGVGAKEFEEEAKKTVSDEVFGGGVFGEFDKD